MSVDIGSSEALEKYTQIIFDRTYRCMCDLVSVSIIQTLPEIDIPQTPFIETVGVHGFNMGVTRSETNNTYELLEVAYGRSRDLAGYEFSQHKGEGSVESHNLTIVQIAEIVAGYGRVDLTSISDGREIAFNISKFLEVEENHSRIDLHHKRPPAEDLQGLKNLLALVDAFLEKAPVKNFNNRRPVRFGNASASTVNNSMTIRRQQEYRDDPRTHSNPFNFSR
jgi:hypothetical protein